MFSLSLFWKDAFYVTVVLNDNFNEYIAMSSQIAPFFVGFHDRWFNVFKHHTLQ